MLRIKERKWIFYVSAFFLLLSLLFCFSAEDRTNLSSYFIPFISAFIFYLLICIQKNNQIKNLLLITIIAWIIALIYPPKLSNDFYRFLWDGELFWNNINPFDFTPNELIEKGLLPKTHYFDELYVGMGKLSQTNYSCYPPLNQFYFIISTAFSTSIYGNVLVMKILILLTNLGGLYYLLKLLLLLKIPFQKAFILFLNPLFILEGFANVHFESVMVSLLIIAFYYLIKSKIILSGVLFAFAIQIKLIPFIFLPFFIRFIGWKKSILLFSVIGVVIILLSIIQLDTENISHFSQSLLLYFKQFEFNSIVLYSLLQTDPFTITWFKIGFYTPLLSLISFLFLMILAFKNKIVDPSILFKRLAIGFFIYFLLSSTIHPWYIIPLLFLSIFTNYAFALLWTFTILFSYSFYNEVNIASTNWLISIEYIPVLLLFIYEMFNGGILTKTDLAIHINASKSKLE